MPGFLSVVATPIGNLGDITARALETLRAADIIAAEDTRHTLNLMRHFAIEKPLLSFHEHNEARRTAELVEKLLAGATVALVTDAGMPSISDPGRRLIDACAAGSIPFTVIPGPSAVTAAIAGSGIPCDRFFFGGFLPVKSGQRERALAEAGASGAAAVFFESPYRLTKTLEVLSRILPARTICVARELTKIHEEYRRGPAADLLAHYTAHPPKGEITVVIGPEERRKAPGGDAPHTS